MSLAYIPPGVTVDELTSPSVAPLLAVPGSICLVGMTAGAITRTDPIQLFGTTAAVLPGVPAGSTMATGAINLVLDALNPSIAPTGYSATTDYTFSNTAFTIVRQVTAQTLSTNVAANATSFTLSAGSVPTIGQVVSLSNQVATFTGTTTQGSPLIPVSATTNLAVGQTVTGTGIPGGATITFVDTGHTQIALSNSATASGTGVSLTSSNTETATVTNVAGQVVTVASGLTYAHTASSPTVAAVTWGTIPDGGTVYVTYAYTPADYFQPIRLTSMADIQNRFGNAWDPTNTFINSPLSFAASLCFQNGASNLVLQPLYTITNNVRVQPSASQAASPTNWATTYTGLYDLQDINIVVPVVGQSAANVTDSIMLQIAEATQDFAFQMLQGNQQYVVGVVGEDSSTSTVNTPLAQEPTLLAHAQTLAPRYNAAVTEQMVFVNTSQFSMANASSSFLVGGQYAAAAVAGMLSARSPSATLTRQAVSGFLSVTDVRTKAQKNNDAANGMLVTESQGQIVVVRHGITMATNSVASRELNVVRAKHYVIETVRNTLDTQVIGRLVADANAPTTVNTLVIGTLEDLRSIGILSDYANVSSRITSLDPTAMEVRFDYQPAFVINYINIAFSLDLTVNAVLVTSNGTATTA